MKTNDNFIIGSGISGLIWKFYHPEFEVIAPVQDQPIKGDQFTRSNMVWLHDCRETRKLLMDLDMLPLISRKCIIGYNVDKWITDKLTPEINLELIEKKMVNWDAKKRDETFVPNSTELSMTSDVGVNYMNVLTVDLNEVIKRLRQKVEVTHGYVHFISDDLLGISNSPENDKGTVYQHYDKLVSTIPANIFWRNYHPATLFNDAVSNSSIRRKIDSFNWLPITNVIVKQQPLMFNDTYEMIYYGFNHFFSRISHISETYTLEFTGEMTAKQFEDLFPQYRIEDIFTVPQGRILSLENPPPTNRIIFSGRFAQWNHTITTEHVLHQAMNYKKGD